MAVHLRAGTSSVALRSHPTRGGDELVNLATWELGRHVLRSLPPCVDTIVVANPRVVFSPPAPEPAATFAASLPEVGLVHYSRGSQGPRFVPELTIGQRQRRQGLERDSQ